MNDAVIAHRGASAHAPENTMDAFELAVEQAAACVEHDLHATKDGALVCIHDATLERTTDAAVRFPARRPWNVGDFTLAEIRELDAGSWFDRSFAGARIPTFDELLEWARGRVRVLTELKDPERHAQRGVDLLALAVSTLRRHAGLDRARDAGVTIQSFDEATVRRAGATIGGRLPIVLLLEPDETPFLSEQRLGEVSTFATGIGPGKPILERDSALVARARAAGLRTTPWTFRPSSVAAPFADVGAEMRHYVFEVGVDAVITDDPAAFGAAARLA